jgi:polar amino acid transport system substrate-binding protein
MSRLPIIRAALTAGTAALLGAALITGCAPKNEGASPSQQQPQPSVNAISCGKDTLATLTKGKLTVGTDQPVYQPWFVDNKPESGDGFESAVAYAVADKLGFAKGEVGWTRVTFNNAIAPGPKSYDFDINEFSITDERKKAVDFSTPYYDVRQTVIALKSSKLAGAKTIADLKTAKLGAQVGTTSFKAITDVVKPTTQPSVYNTNDDAKKALQNKQIDGLVVDLPTAFFITGAEIQDATIVGQLPQPSTQPEQFGLVLDKGSRLTSCVSQAVDSLRSAGKLRELEQKWLAQVAGAPELT